jgi:hypothetical protein
VTRAEKQARVKAALERDPTASNVALAKQTGTSEAFIRLMRQRASNIRPPAVPPLAEAPPQHGEIFDDLLCEVAALVGEPVTPTAYTLPDDPSDLSLPPWLRRTPGDRQEGCHPVVTVTGHD